MVKPGDIIDSGILESYVLGTASSQDIRQIKNLLPLYPELQREIERIEQALLLIAGSHVPEIPASIRENIIAKMFSR